MLNVSWTLAFVYQTLNSNPYEFNLKIHNVVHFKNKFLRTTNPQLCFARKKNKAKQCSLIYKKYVGNSTHKTSDLWF